MYIFIYLFLLYVSPRRLRKQNTRLKLKVGEKKREEKGWGHQSWIKNETVAKMLHLTDHKWAKVGPAFFSYQESKLSKFWSVQCPWHQKQISYSIELLLLTQISDRNISCFLWRIFTTVSWTSLQCICDGLHEAVFFF